MSESESFESSESFASSDSMSDFSEPDLGGAMVASSTGQDVSNNNDLAVVKDKPKQGLLGGFNIFNAMLFASLILILLATFLVFTEAGDYGGLLSSPWRTGSVGR